MGAHFHAKRLADHALDRREMAGARPELQLRIACRAQLQQGVVATVVIVET